MRITKTESTNLADSQSCETPVKQLAPSTPSRSAVFCQLSSVQETEPKQVELPPFPASVSNAEGWFSFHEDGSLPRGGREAQCYVCQSDETEHCINLESDVVTCSNNCSNLHSSISSIYVHICYNSVSILDLLAGRNNYLTT